MSVALSPATLIGLAANRYDSEYIISTRDQVSATLNDWKQDQKDLRSIARGEWASVFPAQVAAESYDPTLKVQNLVMDMIHDTARLVTESAATIRSSALTLSDAEGKKARMHEAIADTYWRCERSEKLIYPLAMDALGDGAMFLLSLPKTGYDYPVHRRLDPLNCFPNIYNDELVDFLVISTMHLNQAQRLFPESFGMVVDPSAEGEVQVIDYYNDDVIARCIVAHVPETNRGYRTKKVRDQGYIVTQMPNPIGKIPVSWWKMPTKDGEFRGMWNQGATIVNTMNRLMTVILDDADAATYSATVFNNIANPQDYGPMAALYPEDPTQEAKAVRVQPAPLQGALFGMVAQQERGARGALNFSEGRQGNAQQSIVSAAGIQAMQGAQVTVVRFLQRFGIAEIRTQQTMLDFAWDKTDTLNYEKPLLAAAGNASTYTPGDDIGDRARMELVYSMFAGEGAYNQTVQILQLWGGGQGLISDETALENIDELAGSDWRSEITKLERSQSRRIFFQALAAQATQGGYPMDRLLYWQDKGLDVFAANAKVQEEIQAAQPQPAQPGALPGVPGQPALPPGQPGAAPADQAAAMAAGQTGAVAPPGISFAPPPLEQIFARTAG